MPSLRKLALALAALTSVEAAFGPSFSTGPVGSGSWIREAISTLVLPAVPTGGSSNKILSLWVGMGTSNGDLVQSIADYYNGASDWDIYAYTLLSTGPNSQRPVQAPGKRAKPGDKVTMHYVFDDASQNYTQYVLVNGVQVSTLSTKDGHAEGFGSAVECAENNCGTVQAHQWLDTKLILNTADPNYKNTNGKSQGVTGDMSTPDGGKTWVVTTINIPKFTFTG